MITGISRTTETTSTTTIATTTTKPICDDELITSMYVSEVFTNLVTNPVPFFIYPGSKGEELNNGTLIHVVLVPEYSALVSKIGILNEDSNVARIEVTFKDIDDNYILTNDNQLMRSSNLEETLATISGDLLPKIPIHEIIIQIVDIIDINKPIRVIITIRGCIQNSK